ncbi:MAG: DNA polymerase II [Crenarchaeota archaeon]|nr:DNA polymerase II [Thermoproteota archaeon]
MGRERIAIYVLDASYEVHGNEPVVLIWGITEDGRRVLLRDKRFRPYFYALLDPSIHGKEDAVLSSIKQLTRPRSPITSVELLEKRFFGKPARVAKIVTVLPESVREYRELVKKLPGVKDVLEADIRFAMRYLIDNAVYPCSWHVFEVEDAGTSPMYVVDRIYDIVSVGERLDRVTPPDMRVMAFDIEVYNPRGAPKASRDPVIIVAVRTSDGRIEQFLAEGRDDRPAIRRFVEFVQSFDPDVIVGYNSNSFDWPYLLERCRYLGIRLEVGRRRGAEPRQSVYGHISVPGRLNVDLYDFAEEMPEVKVKSLDEVAEFLGVMKKSERTNIPWYEIYRYWDDEKLRPKLLAYSRDDVEATYRIAEKLLPFGIQLSAITGVPLDQVMAASVGFRLEWYLIRAAFSYNELVPNRVERPYEPYRGAIVLEPKKGVHENVAVLDFSAMYPSIMMKYNIGPDTIVRDPSECGEAGCYQAPEVGYLFRKEPPGFFKKVLETLVSARKRIKEQMKGLDPRSPEYRVLDERQKALKVLANAAYGYMGWTGARWYCRECAEAVTAWGRETIRRAIELARSLGLTVIYGDTDSLFVKYDPEKVRKFIELVEKELGLEIKIDKVYKRVFFTEAKKRYVGLTESGYIDVVGFEAVRGDWAEIAKEMQEKVAEIVLKTMDPKKAVEFVRKELQRIREEVEKGTAPIEKFVIWKTLSKPLKDYEVEAPHVVAAKYLMKMGYQVEVGDKIGYVIVKGSGKVSERARPYIAVSVKDIDLDYYIDHQIVPAVLRILEYFGITEKQIKTVGKARRTLFDYGKK